MGRPEGRPTTVVLLDRTASGDDLLLGACRDLVDRDGELDGDLAVAQDLDLLVLPNRALGHEVSNGHVATLRVELGALRQGHKLVLDTEGGLEATERRRAHVQGQLTTLEACANLVTGLRTLGTATSGLTLRALTTAHTSAV